MPRQPVVSAIQLRRRVVEHVGIKSEHFGLEAAPPVLMVGVQIRVGKLPDLGGCRHQRVDGQLHLHRSPRHAVGRDRYFGQPVAGDDLVVYGVFYRIYE